MLVRPSVGLARNEAGSSSLNSPLRSKSCESTDCTAMPASWTPSGRAIASGYAWTRPPERSITGRSAASSNASKKIMA